MLVAALFAVARAIGPAELPEPPAEPAAEPGLPEPPVLPPPPSEPEAIRWSAPAGCPSAAELRRGIERRLGRTLAAGEGMLEARVELRDAGGYRLTLRTTAEGVAEPRTLEADDCQALADATALIVALAIDPVAVVEVIEPWSGRDPLELPPPREATPRPGPERAPERRSDARVEPPRDAIEPPPQGRPGGLVRAGAGVGLGAVPGITGALSLAGALRWSRARLELEGAYWIPRTSGAIDGASVRVQLGTTTVRGCGQLARDRIEAPLCGGLQLGGMRGEGVGVDGARIAQGLWLALEASVGLSWWFRPRWALAGGFAAAVPLVEPAFELRGDPPLRLYEPSPVAGRLWLGIELRLNSP